MLENEKIKGIHATRWIMSWIRMDGEIYYGHDHTDFEDWLKSEGLNDDERSTILDIFRSGKMELETSASRFIKTLKTKQ